MRKPNDWAADISNLRKQNPPIYNALAQVEWVEEIPIPIELIEIRTIFEPPLSATPLNLSPLKPNWQVRVLIIRREHVVPKCDYFEFFGIQGRGISTAPVNVPPGPPPALGSQFVLYFRNERLVLAVPLEKALGFDPVLPSWLDEAL